LRFARLPAADHFLDLHTTQFPIPHASHLVVADMVLNRAAGGLIQRDERLAYSFMMKQPPLA